MSYSSPQFVDPSPHNQPPFNMSVQITPVPFDGVRVFDNDVNRYHLSRYCVAIQGLRYKVSDDGHKFTFIYTSHPFACTSTATYTVALDGSTYQILKDIPGGRTTGFYVTQHGAILSISRMNQLTDIWEHFELDTESFFYKAKRVLGDNEPISEELSMEEKRIMNEEACEAFDVGLFVSELDGRKSWEAIEKMQMEIDACDVGIPEAVEVEKEQEIGWVVIHHEEAN